MAAIALCLAAACGSGGSIGTTGGRGGSAGAGGLAGQGSGGAGGQGTAGVAGQGTGGAAGIGAASGAGMGGLGGASGSGGTGGSAGSGGGAGSAPPPPSWFDLPCRIEGWGTPLITAFSPDGSLYAVGGDSGIVKIMRTADDQPIVTVAAHDAAVAVVKIAADNSRFATAGADNTIRVWSMNGDPIASIRALSKSIYGLALSPDGTRLAEVGMEDSVVGRVYAIPQGTQVSFLRWNNLQRFARAAGFSPDGSKVITYGSEVVQWDAATGAMLGSVSLQDTPLFAFIGVTSDANTIVVGEQFAALVFDVRDGHRIARIPWSRLIRSVAISADGRRVAVKAVDPEIGVFDVAAPDWPKYTIPEGTGPTMLAIGATGEELVYEGDSAWRTITHLRLGGGTRADLKVPIQYTIPSLRISPDGQRRAVVDLSGTVYVTSVPDGAAIATLTRSSRDYRDAWFWPPEPQLALAGPTYVDVAPLPTGTVQTLPASVVDGQLAAMSADGNLLAYDAASAVVVRDRAGAIKRTIPRTGKDKLAFSPTGDRLAMGLADGTLQVLALDGGADVPPISAHMKDVYAIAFTPDGNTVVSGGRDGFGGLWRARDLASMRGFMVIPFNEYEALGVVAVAVSPDGGQVAFGVKVNTTYQARLYRIADGELLASFHGLSTSTSAVAFTPDGRRLVLAGGDASIRTYCLP